MTIPITMQLIEAPPNKIPQVKVRVALLRGDVNVSESDTDSGPMRGGGGGVDNGQTQDNSDGQVPPQRCPEAGPGFFSLH